MVLENCSLNNQLSELVGAKLYSHPTHKAKMFSKFLLLLPTFRILPLPYWLSFFIGNEDV